MSLSFLSFSSPLIASAQSPQILDAERAMFAVLLKHHHASALAREFASKVSSATSAPGKLVQLWRASAGELRNFLIQKRQQLAKVVEPSATVAHPEALSTSGHQDLTHFYEFVKTIIERCKFLLKIRVPSPEENKVAPEKISLRDSSSSSHSLQLG